MSRIDQQVSTASVQIPIELRDEIKATTNKSGMRMGRWVEDACREKLKREKEQESK